MSTGAIIGLVIAIVVVCAIAVVVSRELRRAKLRRQFGPEHDRLTRELGSSRKAEAELLARQRQAAKLDIRPLPAGRRGAYAADWTKIQEDFVENPANAVASARRLLARMLRESGYPENQDETVMAISVHNSRALDDYRRAQALGDGSGGDGSGKATTEELREALLRYRTLVDDLVGGARRDAQAATTGKDGEPRKADGGTRKADGETPMRQRLTRALTPANKQGD